MVGKRDIFQQNGKTLKSWLFGRWNVLYMGIFVEQQIPSSYQIIIFYYLR
jgi:hypothetical protein